MTFPSLLYIIIAACVLVACFVAIIILTDQLRHIRSENVTLRSHLSGLEDMAQRDNPYAHTGVEILEAFAKETGCRLTTEEQDDDDIQYTFAYQGGNFYCTAGKNHGIIQLCFFGVDSIPYTRDNLQLVQDVCERENRQYKLGKVIFSYDSEENQLSLGILIDCIYPDTSIIKHYIGLCFTMANDIREALKAPKQPSEEDIIRFKQEQQKMLEGELSHQVPFCANRENHRRVGDLGHLLTIFFHNEEQVEDLLALTVVCDNITEQICQRDKIAHFDVFSTMVDGEGEQAQMRTSPAVLSLETTYRHYTLILHPVADLQDTIYLRLTSVCMPYDNLQQDMPEGTYTPQSISVLMTYDRNTDTTSDRYRMREELQKRPHSIEAAYSYGHQLFLEKRFVEAIVVLEPLFRTLRSNFYQFSDDKKQMFFAICYDIGYCYTELQQYEQAYYYLELVHSMNRIDYSIEYFNCLANGKDIRVFRELSNERDQVAKLIREIDNSDDSGSEENVEHRESLSNYGAFLQRRYGYALININRLDEAEQIFRSLLNNASSHDYAQNELNYIASLRRRSQHLDSTHSATADNTNSTDHPDNPSDTNHNGSADSGDSSTDK